MTDARLDQLSTLGLREDDAAAWLWQFVRARLDLKITDFECAGLCRWARSSALGSYLPLALSRN